MTIIKNSILVCELSFILADNNEPWRKMRGIALGYTNPQKALRDSVDTDDKDKMENLRVNDSICINESGLLTHHVLKITHSKGV